MDRRKVRLLGFCGHSIPLGGCSEDRRTAAARVRGPKASEVLRVQRSSGGSEFCPLCGARYRSLSGHDHRHSGCFLGLLVGSILERGELDFGDRELHRLADSGFGLEWLWEGYGSAATDALEDLLIECGAERRDEEP